MKGIDFFMENTRIGKSEAIALIFTIMVNHVVSCITKTIISSTSSSAILHTVYISIIAIIVSYILYKLLCKFPTFDILDISNYLGGKILKTIVGVIFFCYFVFFSACMLRNFSYFLQVIYYPSTNVLFIASIFLIATIFVCNLKYDAIYRSNLLIIPFIILNILIVFFGNLNNFNYQNVFPVLGNGINSTFFSGLSNLFAFQGLLYILFLPPHLKDTTELKKITLLSILFSAFYLIVSVSTVLLLFDRKVTISLLLPLYSAVRYIEFGTFFQRLDSIFILAWVISFISYLSISIKVCSNILRKVSHTKSPKFSTSFIAVLMFVVTLLSKSFAFFLFILDVVYKYAFLALLAISILILIMAYTVKCVKNKNSSYKRSSLKGGAL